MVSIPLLPSEQIGPSYVDGRNGKNGMKKREVEKSLDYNKPVPSLRRLLVRQFFFASALLWQMTFHLASEEPFVVA